MAVAKSIQTIKIILESIVTDHENFLLIIEEETSAIKTDHQEIFLNHHLETIKRIQIDTLKHQRQINQLQSICEATPGPTENEKKTSEFQLNHIYCDSTVDDSENENTPSID